MKVELLEIHCFLFVIFYQFFILLDSLAMDRNNCRKIFYFLLLLGQKSREFSEFGVLDFSLGLAVEEGGVEGGDTVFLEDFLGELFF